MVEYVTSSIFDSDAAILVCPVNVVGVMGKGLALDFKKKFAGLELGYQHALKSKMLRSTRPVLAHFDTVDVCLFPTKTHWRHDSDLMMIVGNLYSLDNLAQGRSISIPKVGCGLGKLDWEVVRPYIQKVADNSKSLWRVHV